MSKNIITWHGWYSAKQAEHLRESSRSEYAQHGIPFTSPAYEGPIAVYATPSDKLAYVTSVTKSSEDHGTGWDDMVYVGPVTTMIRREWY